MSKVEKLFGQNSHTFLELKFTKEQLEEDVIEPATNQPVEEGSKLWLQNLRLGEPYWEEYVNKAIVAMAIKEASESDSGYEAVVPKWRRKVEILDAIVRGDWNWILPDAFVEELVRISRAIPRNEGKIEGKGKKAIFGRHNHAESWGGEEVDVPKLLSVAFEKLANNYYIDCDKEN